MRRRRDESGVPDTCRFIDEAINELGKCQCDDVDVSGAIAALEKVRTYNSALRSWGNEQLNEAERWESEYRNKETECDELSSDIADLESELNDLRSQQP